MSAYRTVVVGTDGSDSSLRAVEKAAALAGDADATLFIACAYYPADSKASGHDADVLGEDAYQITGSAPTQEILRTARERATSAGATSIEERPVVGNPVDALLELVGETKADLLVVGNRGLNSLTGRLLGSVPSDAARKARCDVLIVHTTR
ncbi:universal stress protein [Rhodococcus kroppenstedtii]|uniref:Universal stress protein n=1 Tax=Rhodococcoides kroppenstedtii TaxID=293050 RepID=A0A1I0UCH9_9NOCA|nr:MULTISPECIES: universal stress protein [Rhodococcus]AMY19255.1 Universal stress protein [Rhodococcus sp. PBTS 1]MBT1192453.1 universal stress protein [Rhodococcus kroppenstedtii]MBY6315047.1 universal stress protein [Rhodococcus kroppenstedtii]MBY6322718.1 universal stress protein [Rhodococcus kroppenstedtii]MBY6349748.1 universal stress protein [Rhodococcus corynebacterioides]